MTQLAIVVVLVLVSSALASGTEAAVFNASYGKVLSAVDEGRWGAVALKAIKDAPERPIMTIVVLNNISNIVGSIVVGALAARVLSANWLGVFSGVLTLLVIVYSEIIPKSLGERYALPIALFVARPLTLLTRFAAPIIWGIELLTRPFMGERRLQAPSEDEIRALTRLGGEQGEIEEGEDALIQRVFHLNDVPAKQLMTPISRADTLKRGQRVSDIREFLEGLTHSRLPVHGENIDEIVGIAHQRDLLLALARGEDSEVSELCKPATFVPASLKGNALIAHFQENKQHQAIVVDDHGTVLGLVTLEDVLEVLVGDIADETDVEIPPLVRQVGPTEVLVDAGASALAVNELLGTTLPEARVGELVVEEVGRIPLVGETIELDEGVIAVVEKASPRMVQRIRVRRS